ncbi:MAG: ATPase [Epulopiscium sp. Nele67-Bin005]|nr:MAG: ATPase [Epulopiscium sp. Nele67-Bin005]
MYQNDIEKIINRQFDITTGLATNLSLPKFKKYSVCNLRGGIGKTTLSFNLSYLADNILTLDTCPQGNLSYFFDDNYFNNYSITVKDLILPYLIPGLGKPTRCSTFVGSSNKWFANKNAFYIPSSDELYLLPSQLSTALHQASSLSSPQKEQAVANILYSLKSEVDREMAENNLDKCLIDTSPFFSGATQLSWHASDALIIPVRTDQQSINSLELLINTLVNPSSEFRRYLPEMVTPKIHMIILTHCGWSTVSGAQSKPNQQTKVYIKKVYDLLNRHRNLLSTNDPSNHLFLLDDFLGSGRISSALSKPLELLQAGETKTIDRVRVTVNQSVDKCKHELNYINRHLW